MKSNKSLKVITGQEKVNRDLGEIITGRKASKFSKYVDRAEYRSALFNMSHIEIMTECTRLGLAPSSEKEFCRNRCLSAFDSAHKNNKVTLPLQRVRSLDDIIAAK